MSIFNKKRYYFSYSSTSVDTIISFVLGIVALLIEISGVIASIATKGHIPEVFGVLYLCAAILAIVGEIFAWFGNGAQEGGATGKRVSIILNIIAVVIPFVFYFMGA